MEAMKMDSSSSSSEVGPTEDVVEALLEYLVYPLLPLKSSAQKAPSISQQQSVAKQVHAVVLLYNYYQRKRHPEVEFLGFDAFCKLAVTLKPNLIAHMKLMHQSDYTELNDLENQLSVTEKAIMNACNICSALDASKDVPCTEEWPISKVAVFLIDSRKENCLLLFSSVTHGVWSVIEKDLDISNISPESSVVGKHINKRKRISKKPWKEEQDADEDSFQQLALSAVTETTGINQADLMVLESHVVYSLSKEKTNTRFFIVQSTQSTNKDLQVPIKDAIESLQGPLVKKSSGSWTVAPVVEYFHVLPYAGMVSDWFSRIMFSNSLQDLRVGLGNVDANSTERTGIPCDKEVGESVEVFSNSMKNLKVAFGSVDVNSSRKTENLCDKEVGESKEVFSNSSLNQKVGLVNVNVNSSQRTDNPCNKEVTKNRDRLDKTCSVAECFGNKASGVNSSQRTEYPCDKEVNRSRDTSEKNCGFADSIGQEASGTNTESPRQKDNNGCFVIGLSNSLNGPHSMDIDDTSVVCPRKEDKIKNTHMTVKVYHHQKKRMPSTESDINASISGAKIKVEVTDPVMKSRITECRGEKVDGENKTCSTVSFDQDGMPIGNRALVHFQTNAEHLENVADCAMKSRITECRGEKVDGENKTCGVVSSDQDGMPIGDRALVPFQMDTKHLENANVADSAMKSSITECRGEKVDGENKTCDTISSDQDGMPIGDLALVPFQMDTKHLENAEVADSAMKSSITECRGEKVDGENKTCGIVSSDQDGMPIRDRALIPFQMNAKHLENVQFTLDAKENALSQTALRVLVRKKEKLSHQLRNLEDEIAVCDKNIQKIIDGHEDTLAVQLDTIIDCCNGVFLTQSEDGSYQHVEDQRSPQCVKGKRLSDAVLTLRTPCQELDDICYANNWSSTYLVSPSDGGFKGNVAVKGLDFECSGGSELHFNPREARESAAAQMIAKLQSMASQTQ